MNVYEATEIAYKNGYEAGKRDAVKHGLWIGQRCSVCNGNYMDYADADSYPAIGEPKPNYCPHCGAKMDLEEIK